MLVFMLSDTKLVCFVKCIVIGQQLCAFRWCHILFCIFQAPTSFPIAGLMDETMHWVIFCIFHLLLLYTETKEKKQKRTGWRKYWRPRLSRFAGRPLNVHNCLYSPQISQVGLSLDSEDSSSFALGGLAPYPPPEEEEEEEEEDEDSD